jgi:hypothetical protein
MRRVVAVWIRPGALFGQVIPQMWGSKLHGASNASLGYRARTTSTKYLRSTNDMIAWPSLLHLDIMPGRCWAVYMIINYCFLSLLSAAMTPSLNSSCFLAVDGEPAL